MHISPFIGHIPDLSKTGFDDSFYQSMRDDFNALFDAGLFKQVALQPAYYLVEIKNKNNVSTGLVAMTSMQEYNDQNILKHEQTISKKEKLHKALLTSRKAMIKPVALLMPHQKTLQQEFEAIKIKSKPILRIRFPDLTTTQKLWRVDAPVLIKKITSLFEKKINKVIIADGHHRFASLARLQSSKNPASILSIYFSPDQMQVSTFYRVVKKRSSQSYEQLIKKLREHTTTWQKTTSIIVERGCIHLFLKGELYRFRLKSSGSQPVHLSFSEQILGPVFEIHKETTSKRISYLEAPQNETERGRILEEHKDEFVFMLPPLTTHQILRNKKILPPKSTLFSPRIMNGLIVALT